MKKETRFLTEGALIAALYIALTFLSRAVGLDSGAVQLRLSEALTVLPVFTSAAVPGLFVGCLLANTLTGCAVWDVVFGAAATLLGAFGTRLFAQKKRRLAPIFPIITNTAIVPVILKTVYGTKMAYPLLCLAIFIGELISCGILGQALIGIIEKSGVFKK